MGKKRKERHLGFFDRCGLIREMPHRAPSLVRSVAAVISIGIGCKERLRGDRGSHADRLSIRLIGNVQRIAASELHAARAKGAQVEHTCHLHKRQFGRGNVHRFGHLHK